MVSELVRRQRALRFCERNLYRLERVSGRRAASRVGAAPLATLTVAFLTALFLVASAAVAAPEGTKSAPATASRQSVNEVLIIDLSKSMRGVGGTANIFDHVKSTCTELVRQLQPGDTVTLITFGDAAQVYPTVTLQGENEKDRLGDMIESFRASSNWTYTADALRAGLKEAGRLEKEFPKHQQIVLILTDGINDPPPGARKEGLTLAKAARPYLGKPWWVYQVQLGPETDPDLDRVLKDFPHGRTIHDPRGVELSSLPKKIQAETKPQVKKVVLTPSPKSLKVELEKLHQAKSVSFKVRLPVGLSPDSVEAQVNRGTLPVSVTLKVVKSSPGPDEAVFEARVVASSTVANGSYRGHLRLALHPATVGFSAQPVVVPLDVETELVPAVWPRYFLIALLLALVCGGVVSFWRFRSSRKLFGTLRYWRLDDPTDKQSIDDLSKLGTSAKIGGSRIPLEGGDGSLIAALSTRKDDGEVHVVVSPLGSKSITLDGRHFPELVLYDADTFDIDQWSFQYRGPVGRRPSADL